MIAMCSAGSLNAASDIRKQSRRTELWCLNAGAYGQRRLGSSRAQNVNGPNPCAVPVFIGCATTGLKAFGCNRGRWEWSWTHVVLAVMGDAWQ